MDFPKQNEIQTYSTNSDLKAIFVERFNGTLLDLIKEPMYIELKACWLNHINSALDKYNNRVHTTTPVTPFEANNKPIDPSTFVNTPKQPKVQVGDYVRVPDKRNIYSKGYPTNWNRELFKIQRVNKTNPVTYGLVDENNEQVEKKYYEQELLRSVFNFKSNKNVRKLNIFHKFE